MVRARVRPSLINSLHRDVKEGRSRSVSNSSDHFRRKSFNESAVVLDGNVAVVGSSVRGLSGGVEDWSVVEVCKCVGLGGWWASPSSFRLSSLGGGVVGTAAAGVGSGPKKSTARGRLFGRGSGCGVWMIFSIKGGMRFVAGSGE